MNRMICAAGVWACLGLPVAWGQEVAAKPQMAGDVWREIFEPGPAWASPTKGKPLDLKHLVSGMSFLAAARPALLLKHPEGERVCDEKTLGPVLPWLRKYVEEAAGVPLEQMDQLLLGLLDANGGLSRLAMKVRTIEPLDKPRLLAHWHEPAATKAAEHTVYLGEAFAYYFPADGHTLALCPRSYDQVEMAEFIACLVGTQTPRLRLELESVLAQSDDRRHLTVAGTPGFLFYGGKPLIAGTPVRFQQALLYQLQGDPAQQALAKAVQLSLHLSDDLFYSELRLHGGSAQPASVLAKEFHQRLLAVPGEVRDLYTTAQTDAGPYKPSERARTVLARYPMMLSAWTAYLRTHVEGRQVVSRSVLPLTAAHNLALGTQLVLNDLQTAPPRLELNKPTLRQALQRRITLKVPSDGFDRMAPLVEEELGFPIVFTSDLETEGITKCKRYSIDEENQTIEDVLMALCREGNPTAGIFDLTSPDMKLVWVLSPDETKILITIRSRAADRGQPPPAFGIK